ncbi:unnamed protein product [Lactuca saligna]|uniref:Uncharacterized protein n=1 Tax=Lactuca saligna TaxID=75948 RepID=A0AA36EPD2_LACSI|nr:unnamed protein product [Lactuca saligna]
MWELTILLPKEVGNVGPSGPASSSQSGVEATFPASSPDSTSTDTHVVVQPRKSTTLMRRKQSMRMVILLEIETGSDNVGLRPLERDSSNAKFFKDISVPVLSFEVHWACRKAFPHQTYLRWLKK